MADAISTRILAVEGPDGSGKTSIAQGLAARLGGRYVKPFDGTVGLVIRWLHERADHELASRVAWAAATRAVEVNQDAPWLIFDRHWVSVLAFTARAVPQIWMPPPPTVVCLAQRSAIAGRLQQRGASPEEIESSAGIVERFERLVKDYALPVIDTTGTTPEEAVEQILRSGLLERR